jgi:hypothetical protein
MSIIFAKIKTNVKKSNNNLTGFKLILKWHTGLLTVMAGVCDNCNDILSWINLGGIKRL